MSAETFNTASEPEQSATLADYPPKAFENVLEIRLRADLARAFMHNPRDMETRRLLAAIDQIGAEGIVVIATDQGGYGGMFLKRPQDSIQSYAFPAKPLAPMSPDSYKSRGATTTTTSEFTKQAEAAPFIIDPEFHYSNAAAEKPGLPFINYVMKISGTQLYFDHAPEYIV